jgi:hypothetical protein
VVCAFLQYLILYIGCTCMFAGMDCIVLYRSKAYFITASTSVGSCCIDEDDTTFVIYARGIEWEENEDVIG